MIMCIYDVNFDAIQSLLNAKLVLNTFYYSSLLLLQKNEIWSLAKMKIEKVAKHCVTTDNDESTNDGKLGGLNVGNSQICKWEQWQTLVKLYCVYMCDEELV